jgi:hypothetical protein
MNETINDSCIICFNNISEDSLCRTNCNHIYCKGCLHTWFDRGKIDCPMCRLNIKSYKNKGAQNHIIVVDTPNETRIQIEEVNNNSIIADMYKKIKCMRFYFCINLVYIGYLHYENFILWKDCK